MLATLAIANYRSIRELVLPLGQLNLVSGANGTGKSNLYRALRLLSEAGTGTLVNALAREGGLESVLWAGPESGSKSGVRAEQPLQGGPRRSRVALRLGFTGDGLGYAIDIGLPVPAASLFLHDPEIKREVIFSGESWHERRALVDRRGAVVRVRDETGHWQVVEQHLPAFDSVLTRLADPRLAPEVLMLRDELRSFRFYDHLRADERAPARLPHVGTRTPVLGNDGADLAAAWRTIEEIGDRDALAAALDDAFPGASVSVSAEAGRFSLAFHQPGLLRPLTQAELSDGTLRYLFWIAALLTPRPPPLMVLNEPETSLHPDLLPALGRLMAAYARQDQLWVVTHSPVLCEALGGRPETRSLVLDKESGETFVHDQDPLDGPAWRWPGR